MSATRIFSLACYFFVWMNTFFYNQSWPATLLAGPNKSSSIFHFGNGLGLIVSPGDVGRVQSFLLQGPRLWLALQDVASMSLVLLLPLTSFFPNGTKRQGTVSSICLLLLDWMIYLMHFPLSENLLICLGKMLSNPSLCAQLPPRPRWTTVRSHMTTWDSDSISSPTKFCLSHTY